MSLIIEYPHPYQPLVWDFNKTNAEIIKPHLMIGPHHGLIFLSKVKLSGKNGFIRHVKNGYTCNDYFQLQEAFCFFFSFFASHSTPLDHNSKIPEIHTYTTNNQLSSLQSDDND